MSPPHYSDHTRHDLAFNAWQCECGLWWMSRNDEDVFQFPAYPWRRWYDEGLSVKQAIEQANTMLFGRPQGA